MENVIEVLQGLRIVTNTMYDLFLTETRAIAAVVLHFSDLGDELEKPSLLNILIGSALKEREAKMRSRRLIEERRLAFKSKTLDEILAANRTNIEIVYDNIEGVHIKRGFRAAYLVFVIQGRPKREISFSFEPKRTTEVEGKISRVFRNKVLKA